jgi:hypothetical protein
MVIPIVDVVLKFFLAFADWPGRKQTDDVPRG